MGMLRIHASLAAACRAWKATKTQRTRSARFMMYSFFPMEPGAVHITRLRRALPGALAVAVVLAAYAWFGGGASFNFPRIGWDQSYYASLSEGFFRGHLYMAYQPDPRLMALPFPYDYKAREGHVDYVWDASYFNGHYYLYFSPLPALIFYMPYRLLRGGYPRDALAAAVFASWAL